MKLHLLDCDSDLMEANDHSSWDDITACKKDLITDLQRGKLSLFYLPFRLVDTDSAENYSEMDVHAQINKIYISLDVEEFHVNKEESYA